MEQEVRITATTAKVLRAFLEDPTEPHYGFALMQATGLASGTLYPILTRLTSAGWLTRHAEDVDPASAGRPARRMYLLTPAAVPLARTEMARLAAEMAPPASPGWRPFPAGGTA